MRIAAWVVPCMRRSHDHAAAGLATSIASARRTSPKCGKLSVDAFGVIVESGRPTSPEKNMEPYLNLA